jgi:hypothetical protein
MPDPNTITGDCLLVKKNLLENKLAAPIAIWMRDKGYVVYAETPYYSHCIDLIGKSENDELIAVELKLCLTQEVFQQAERTRGFAHRCYVGIGSIPKQLSVSKCAQYGIGILVVKKDVVQEVLSAKTQNPISSLTEHIIGNLHNCPPSDDAGKPNLKGEGPAQEVAKRVRAYKTNHPSARWIEIYENVPNYYCSHRSMANALVSRGLVK